MVIFDQTKRYTKRNPNLNTSEKYNSNVKKWKHSLNFVHSSQYFLFFPAVNYTILATSKVEALKKIVQIDGCFLCVTLIPSELASIIYN